MPLADKLRPKSLDDVIGQEHILGENGLLRRIAENGTLTNLIFYGPPGVGKTTVANIIAKNSGKKLYKLNGTTASTADIKDIISNLGGIDSLSGVLLYIDEIQYLNKKQQQTLLEHIENGDITLIASTTENPYFYIYNAILSRSTVFEFKPVSVEAIEKALIRGYNKLNEDGKLSIEDGVINYIATHCGGDVRKSMNALEITYLGAITSENDTKLMTLADAMQVTQKSEINFDRDGENHYDYMSGLQKSIRGSDPDAALFYLAKFIEAGDIISPARRLLVVASEDIGLAYPMAIAIVKACVDSALQLGLPEARIPLAEATVFLATQPKSNSSYLAMDKMLTAVKAGKGKTVPRAVQNKHYDGADVQNKGQNYLYPHNYPNHYIFQQYIPDDLVNEQFYVYGENKLEQTTKAYWDKIK